MDGQSCTKYSMGVVGSLILQGRLIIVLLLMGVTLTGCSDKTEQNDVIVVDASSAVAVESPGEKQFEQTDTADGEDRQEKTPSVQPLDLSLPENIATLEDSEQSIADAPANKLPNLFDREEKEGAVSMSLSPIYEPEQLTDLPKIKGASVNVELKIK